MMAGYVSYGINPRQVGPHLGIRRHATIERDPRFSKISGIRYPPDSDEDFFFRYLLEGLDARPCFYRDAPFSKIRCQDTDNFPVFQGQECFAHFVNRNRNVEPP